MNKVSRGLAWCLVAALGVFMSVYLITGAIASPDDPNDFPYQEFSRLPVLDHGRVKPMDTLARVSLMILSGRQEWTDRDGNTQPAIRWLLDVMSAEMRNKQRDAEPGEIAGSSRDVKAYRIEDPAIRQMLKVDGSNEELFSYAEILKAAGPAGMRYFFEESEKLHQPASDQLTGRDKAIVDLYLQLRAHIQFSQYETPHRVFRIDNFEVLNLLGLEGRDRYRYGFDELLPRLAPLEREARRAVALPQRNRSVYENKLIEVFKHVELYVGLAVGNVETLHLVVPNARGEDWRVLPRALAEARQALQAKDPGAMEDFNATAYFQGMLMSYARDDKKRFNEALAGYTKIAVQTVGQEMETASTETGFNSFEPFFRCSLLYVIILLVACVSWLWRDVVINRFAFWAMVLVLLVHTSALIGRMYIQGRPPVTNLYSSAVFIGWACVLLCAFFELKFRNGIATAVGSLTGFATLLIAHYLGGSGDTLEMMQAVLDTNFWLATHVTAVTIGYAATFVAGGFGLLYLWMMLVTTVMNSLRQGGRFPFGQAILFSIAALGVMVFVAVLFAGLLAGLWYRAERNPIVGILFAVLAVMALAAAVSYAVYLLIQRVKLASLAETPLRLPSGTRALENFALTEDTRRVLSWMIYGTVCFATLFSFVGTVLGGIWADQSWGRFWGWDPKENGALLIVIMNSLILHARWGGMIKERGMAILTLLGNMVTMWSWFGTNQLGIGLHAYGFNNALVVLCSCFWISQLGLIALALLPYPNWRSYAPLPIEETQPTKKKERRAQGKRGDVGIQPA